MTDIVDRLRSLNADFLHEEAADEIERLRAALEKIAARVDRLTGGLTYTEKAARDIARAALGEARA
jgi:cell division protein FtsB